MATNTTITTPGTPMSTPAVAATEIHAAAERMRRVLAEHVSTGSNGSRRDAGARAMAHVTAVCEVRNAARRAALDSSDGAIADAMQRLVREALHILGPDALHDLIAAARADRDRTWLREIACEALHDGHLERAVAARAVASVGAKALHDALAIRAGDEPVWRLNSDEIIRTQYCVRHDVFCCLECPDEPTGPLAPIRRACVV